MQDSNFCMWRVSLFVSYWAYLQDVPNLFIQHLKFHSPFWSNDPCDRKPLISELLPYLGQCGLHSKRLIISKDSDCTTAENMFMSVTGFHVSAQLPIDFSTNSPQELIKRSLYSHTKEFKILLSTAVQESNWQEYTGASGRSIEKGRTRVLSTWTKR